MAARRSSGKVLPVFQPPPLPLSLLSDFGSKALELSTLEEFLHINHEESPTDSELSNGRDKYAGRNRWTIFSPPSYRNHMRQLDQ